MCKLGRPVYCERIGNLDVDNLWKVTTEERMFRDFAAGFEALIHFRIPACSLAAGRRIE